MHTNGTCGGCGIPLGHGKGKGCAPPGCGCQAGDGDKGQQQVSRGTEYRHQQLLILRVPLLRSLFVSPPLNIHAGQIGQKRDPPPKSKEPHPKNQSEIIASIHKLLGG
jgi:hypothetical protein